MFGYPSDDVMGASGLPYQGHKNTTGDTVEGSNSSNLIGNSGCDWESEPGFNEANIVAATLGDVVLEAAVAKRIRHQYIVPPPLTKPEYQLDLLPILEQLPYLRCVSIEERRFGFRSPMEPFNV